MKSLIMLVSILAAVIGVHSKQPTVLEKLRDDPDLSQFFDLLTRNEVAMASIKRRSVTLFAPTNQAFQHFTGNSTNVLYHMLTVAKRIEDIGSSANTDLDGNPPIYITKVDEDYYVNNALVLKSKSNYVANNEAGKRQVLHILDDVLSPLTVNPSSSVELDNPDAFQFLQNSESLNIGHHRVRSYRQRVLLMKKEHVFQSVGGHTFFVPVEEGFKPTPRPDLIDKKVIDGHIIPDSVIFTSSAPLNIAQNTMAFEDNMKVTVTFFTQTDGKSTKTYVKSNTIVGDGKHSAGVVLAEIVKANIPVKNGVVHLIHRPLMVVDTTVTQFLENMPKTNSISSRNSTTSSKEKEDGPLFEFYQVILDTGDEFMQRINNLRDVTLLAPSNEAWKSPNLKNIIRNKEKMSEILKMHVIRDRISVDRIRQANQNQIFQVPTMADRKSLYFNVLTSRDGNQTVTVEGAGVNATLVQADIAATNGFVHIIDRVLGVPHDTVQQKLETDPMMNSTNFLGQRTGFNQQLNNSNVRYTYFVPRDKAWERSEIEFPTAFKKLFMPDFNYHARGILERHLVVADRVFTMGDLKLLSNDTVPVLLQTVRDPLRIRVKEQSKRYTIIWHNREIPVFRPDVECINGIIHVIDHPLLEESDVRAASVNGATTTTNFVLNSILVNLLMTLMARLFV